MSIITVKDLPEGSGTLSLDDIFLFMDNPSGSGITKKVSLGRIASLISGSGGGGLPSFGGGIAGGSSYSPSTSNIFDQTLNTYDFPTFSGISLTNSTTLAQGTYDNNTGGNKGISLNCYVGYELNWQGGHLKSTSNNGANTENILFDSPIQFVGENSYNMTINNSGLVFPDGSQQNTSSNNGSVFDLGSVSGSYSINYSNDKMIQLFSLDGTSTELAKGSGWNTSSLVSNDMVLKITASSPTAIIWSIVTDWFSQPDPGPLASGVHLFLLRSIGASTIEGHYLGHKTN